MLVGMEKVMPEQFDESDPRVLVVYEAEGHNHAEKLELWLNKWVEKMETAQERFGVILVNHAHEHDEDHPHERDEEEENAVTALAVKFRRDNRARTNQWTTGYASVVASEISPEKWEAAQQRTAQFADYIFGIRGMLFKDEASARQWLSEIAELPPLPLADVGAKDTKAATTAIFYGSTTGSTEIVAEKIQSIWTKQVGETPPMVNVGNTSELMQLLSYDKLLLGIPTWNVGKLQDDWEVVYPYLDMVDLSGKRIAIFGIGDQYGYPENFQDAMGILGKKLMERGAELVGYTSTEGYEHTYSRGVDGDQFMGLAIDDINQSDLTDGRIANWVAQVQAEFEAAISAPA